ncbi:phosphoenolpyruvate--protein phosphotransferase [Desulfobotulus sp. H1]|uniref:phosphoenolpyruvate--protein phosphotransferase n=1 Tax=Desulfobotulus pelophilus TaxID=2823377 RepID=A0ABT3N6Q3_9BACT|nr:phosphoenolpyruvate--protein phosphotransferase [Desulfobotulus pelophilus]MCW7753145.1 phosphoenolpyruvate--protein phosphotransferase [Desulfobotulus pelophilus]
MQTGYADHLNLLCDMGELISVLRDSDDIHMFLDQTVALVARHLKAQVCSIYLYDESAERLVLRATMGLRAEAVGVVSMAAGEGLVGRVFDSLQPLCTGECRIHPDYLYFSEAGEDQLLSFLAVPIHRGAVRIGVLVVQHEQADSFGDMDVRALRATASQLGSALENARLLLSLGGGAEGSAGLFQARTPSLSLVRGKAASPGCAMGPALILGMHRCDILRDEAEPERSGGMACFHAALDKTLAELNALQERFARRLPESASLIFTAHFMMLKDPSFRRRIEEKINLGLSPMAAVRAAAGHYIAIFASSSHAYIREKVSDIEDLACRLLRNLKPGEGKDAEGVKNGGIALAGELFPSDVLKLVSEDVTGIVLVSGGLTSHVAILCRSLQIPLVIVEESGVLRIPEGTPLLVDGAAGNLYVRPDDSIREPFVRTQAAWSAAESFTGTMSESTWSRDGGRVRLFANINLLSEVPLAIRSRAEGIGLYRSEFPFLIRSAFPTETEQYQVYRRLFAAMPDRVVTIRTLDAGGEKVLSHVDSAGESNPELGLRSIRFSLLHRDVFEAQIRAILRAAEGSVCPRIMFPMISSLDEFREARSIVYDCMTALEKEGISYHSAPQIGMMVELPAALELIEDFAEEADFFSIGTNDLVQYMLAVDRSNPRVAHYYQPWHPSVLRALARIGKAGRAAGVDVSVCGEMAHEPALIPFLLGVGIRTLSLDPQFMPAVQQQIQTMDLREAEEHARELLGMSSIASVASYIGVEKRA